MRVLFRMAIGACGRQAAVMRIIAVAPGTRCFCVTAEQWVICQLMIEACAIETGQLIAAPMMLAMTGFAGLRPRRRFAVIPPAALHVCRNAFMTCETFSILRFAGKGGVAAGTIRLKLRMRTGQGARRDEALHDRLRRQGLHVEQRCNNDQKAKDRPH